jgi:hypothetical protein
LQAASSTGCAVGEQLGPVVVPLEVVPLLELLLVVPEPVDPLLVEPELELTPVLPAVPIVPLVVPIVELPVDPEVPLVPAEVGEPPRVPLAPSFGEYDTPQPEAKSTRRPKLEGRDLSMVDFLSGVVGPIGPAAAPPR